MIVDRKFVAHLVILLAFVVCDWRAEGHAPSVPVPQTRPAKTQLPPYQDVLHSMAVARQELRNAYREAKSSEEQATVLRRARQQLYTGICNDILPQWLGTPWSFNGTTQTPRKGEIACGYFVTTVLRDAGFKVQKVLLAQQASEYIIKSLISEAHIRRFSNVPIKDFVRSVRDWGPGLYVVGLDIHIGFIVYDERGVFFVHSSYLPPKMVIREDAVESPILSSSRYRVLGKLSADDSLLIKWLQGQAIPTRTR